MSLLHITISFIMFSEMLKGGPSLGKTEDGRACSQAHHDLAIVVSKSNQADFKEWKRVELNSKRSPQSFAFSQGRSF